MERTGEPMREQKPPYYATVSLGGHREKTQPDADGGESPDWDDAVFAFDLDGYGAQQQLVVVEFEVKAQLADLADGARRRDEADHRQDGDVELHLLDAPGLLHPRLGVQRRALEDEAAMMLQDEAAMRASSSPAAMAAVEYATWVLDEMPIRIES
ncbi:unnamed protein product [Miscanthus lutarioriparius]|uniref:C2 domain-containing protein n=1 Tax=Miscanthus lutarioriparius TaxID=422564 RepID=A0A811NYN7_9POAL|nr:unnamed protein product [Miscanthus lutarioriparius]